MFMILKTETGTKICMHSPLPHTSPKKLFTLFYTSNFLSSATIHTTTVYTHLVDVVVVSG